MDTGGFIVRAMLAHPGGVSHRKTNDFGWIGGQYIYSDTVYKSGIEPVTVKCAKHGNFTVMPMEHLHPGNRTGRCRKCC